VALGLLDRLALREEREAAAGVQLPQPAGRRQSDDHQRDLRADPQARTDGGVWFPRGGTNALVAAMVRHFERLGGTMRLGDPVEEIETMGDRVTGVRTRSGWSDQFDQVASNGDIVHSYDLLKNSRHGARSAQKLRRKRFSPSLFVVHFGVRGDYPEIPHHTILFGPRYHGLLSDIYDHGVLSKDFSLYLHHPTVTDPSLAPPGCSSYYVLAPVPHMGKLAVDWDEEGPRLADRILQHLEERIMPGCASGSRSASIMPRPISKPISTPISAPPSAWSRC
jgi:phytoene desaturase